MRPLPSLSKTRHTRQWLRLHTILTALGIMVAVVGMVLVPSDLGYGLIAAGLGIPALANFVNWFVRLGSP